jgi:poly(A) polymerase
MQKLLLTAFFFISIANFSKAQNWTNSYNAGTLDSNGNYRGGNEIMHIVSHKGKLYAGNSYWMETSTSQPKSPEIIRLDGVSAEWKVDKDFTTDELRVNALKSIIFTTDSIGNPITPDTLLISSPTNNQGQLKVYIRDDAFNTWTEVFLAQLSVQANIRAIGNYIDPITGIQKIFVGAKGVGIIAGSYSPTRPGKIKWEPTPEFFDPNVGRFMSFTICNGKLFCAADKDTLANNNIGQIYERNNGLNPSWTKRYASNVGGGAENTRGLTTIQSPTSIGEELILSWQSVVRRLQPLNNYSLVNEAALVDTLEQQTGYNCNYVLAAYNEFFPFTIPSTGEQVHLVGFEATYSSSQNPMPPTYNGSNWATDGRYFIRHQNGSNISYELKYIVNNTPTIIDTLVATRAFCKSPFPNDSNVLYVGGFDCNSIPSSNQAWIYRGNFNSTTVGINEVKSNNSISVYPNPSTKEINFVLPSQNNFTVEIINTIGITVLKNQNEKTIDISQLTTGIYFIKIYQDYNIFNSKFIKQ